ncbi:flagellar protein FlhE [Brenneria nigrifluens]|uniref:Flagellar protein FlhE n=2 Tax=Pectobacteriaceae TaxID=1903410 RepID=A0A2U1UUL7_9GAMM|nr:flagellar FlhE family protein [Brenneria sp. EniD312]PWC25374.1 flagellar protein FlhE [Brenneria nigrifluens] [Brenneria nigrifluens DSM 30175 = ATCC 13028]QCR05126.1 flagellar protein FlhE [Brenneria nigrifluens] [Brenneria nigrifluens DSM 30175 = ATCC 13028]
MRMVKLLLAALFIPAVAFATPGAWNASKNGVVLQHRGVTAASPAFLPTANMEVGSDSTITLIHWRYESLSPPPVGLVVRLCTLQRCVNLQGGSGQTRSFTGLPANSEFRFIYYIEGTGRLNRVFNVHSISIAVNYK